MTVKHAERVFEKLELEGEWYLPETPNVRCHGTLNYDVIGNNHLKLWGILDKKRNLGHNYAVIYGVTKGGCKVTIFDATLDNLNMRCGNSSPATYHLEFFVFRFWVGEHFNSSDDVELKSFSFGINNLENWHNIKAFSSEERGDQTVIQYNRPSELLLFEDDYVKISLYYEFTHRSSIAQLSADLEHAARINISAKNDKMSYYSYGKDTLSIEYYFKHIQNFFWGIIGREVFTYCHEARIETIAKTIEESHNEYPVMADEINKKREYPLEVEYYWSRSIEAGELKKRHVEEMIFPFEFIQNDIEELMIKWFRQKSIIIVAVDSYIEFRIKINSFTKATLSLLIFAIEGLHRTLHPELDEKHKQKAIDLILKCPEKIRKDVDKRIMKWCSLHERLHKLLKEYKIVFPVFYQERVKIVEDLLSVRNNISHAKAEKISINFNLQFVYARFLSLLLSAMFMNIAGMEKEKIAERFSNLLQLKEINKKIKK